MTIHKLLLKVPKSKGNSNPTNYKWIDMDKDPTTRQNWGSGWTKDGCLIPKYGNICTGNEEPPNILSGKSINIKHDDTISNYSLITLSNVPDTT